MTVDLAEVAYIAWVTEMHAAQRRAWASAELDDEAAVEEPFSEPLELLGWDELGEVESALWIAVEDAFVRACEADPVARPPVEYALENPLPGLKKANGEALPPGKWPKPASRFRVKAATAGACLAAEKHDGAEREFRIVFACMEPVAGRWSWSSFGELDEVDVTEVRRLVFTGGERLDGRLYEAWRAAMLEQVALEVVASLHPEDALCFLSLELQGDDDGPGQARLAVVAALEARAEAEPVGEERWGDEPPAWPSCPSWETIVLTGDPNRYVWHEVAFALASADADPRALAAGDGGEAERLALFSPGLPRELVARTRLRTKDMIAMRRGTCVEAMMLNLVASLCGVTAAQLREATLDDYERIVRFGRACLGNRRRERAQKNPKKNGSRRGSARSAATPRPSPTASGSTSPSP